MKQIINFLSAFFILSVSAIAQSGSSDLTPGLIVQNSVANGTSLPTPIILLPLINSSYIVTYNRKDVKMEWKSETVDQVGNFTIERSVDNVNFREIAIVLATDQVSYYRYTDANVSSATGVLYYRILYEDKTGESKYSAIKVVRLTKDGNAFLMAYPNPVQSTLNLTLPLTWQSKPVNIALFNSAGTEVQNINIKAASQTETMDFDRLSKGVYVLKAQSGDVWLEQRILRN